MTELFDALMQVVYALGAVLFAVTHLGYVLVGDLFYLVVGIVYTFAIAILCFTLPAFCTSKDYNTQESRGGYGFLVGFVAGVCLSIHMLCTYSVLESVQMILGLMLVEFIVVGIPLIWYQCRDTRRPDADCCA